MSSIIIRNGANKIHKTGKKTENYDRWCAMYTIEIDLKYKSNVT